MYIYESEFVVWCTLSRACILSKCLCFCVLCCIVHVGHSSAVGGGLVLSRVRLLRPQGQ